jgi:putative hemolysin
VNGLLIISGSSAFVPALADILVAMLPSFIDLTLCKTSKSAATLKADAVLLELGVDLLAAKARAIRLEWSPGWTPVCALLRCNDHSHGTSVPASRYCKQDLGQQRRTVRLQTGLAGICGGLAVKVTRLSDTNLAPCNRVA